MKSFLIQNNFIKVDCMINDMYSPNNECVEMFANRNMRQTMTIDNGWKLFSCCDTLHIC